MSDDFDFAAAFAELANGNADLAAEAEKNAAEVKATPAKDGLAYAGDFDGANGHTYSRYTLTYEGKNAFDVLIDNFIEVPVPADMGHAPAGITAHTMVVVKPGQVSGITTTGLAFRTPHNDGTGTHIDGRTVQSYIYPRVMRLMVQLYV